MAQPTLPGSIVARPPEYPDVDPSYAIGHAAEMTHGAGESVEQTKEERQPPDFVGSFFDFIGQHTLGGYYDPMRRASAALVEGQKAAQLRASVGGPRWAATVPLVPRAMPEPLPVPQNAAEAVPLVDSEHPLTGPYNRYVFGAKLHELLKAAEEEKGKPPAEKLNEFLDRYYEPYRSWLHSTLPLEPKEPEPTNVFAMIEEIKHIRESYPETRQGAIDAAGNQRIQDLLIRIGGAIYEPAVLNAYPWLHWAASEAELATRPARRGVGTAGRITIGQPPPKVEALTPHTQAKEIVGGYAATTRITQNPTASQLRLIRREAEAAGDTASEFFDPVTKRHYAWPSSEPMPEALRKTLGRHLQVTPETTGKPISGGEGAPEPSGSAGSDQLMLPPLHMQRVAMQHLTGGMGESTFEADSPYLSEAQRARVEMGQRLRSGLSTEADIKDLAGRAAAYEKGFLGMGMTPEGARAQAEADVLSQQRWAEAAGLTKEAAAALAWMLPEMFMSTVHAVKRAMDNPYQADPLDMLAAAAVPPTMEAFGVARALGVPRAAEGGIPTFHGSPHAWEAIDPTKAGTGEGGAMAGFGFYQAEAQGVARHYKSPTFGDVPGLGHLYELRLMRKADEFLDLDKKLHEQSPGVQRILADKFGIKAMAPASEAEIAAARDRVAKLQKSLNEVSSTTTAGMLQRAKFDLRTLTGNADYTGDEIYRRISLLSGSAAKASAALDEAGIPGARYLDQKSRGAAQAAQAMRQRGIPGAGLYEGGYTSNYVSYNPVRDIVVLSRDGKPIAAPELLRMEEMRIAPQAARLGVPVFVTGEQVPYAPSGHMAGMTSTPAWVRQRYSDSASWLDRNGRDPLMMDLGMFTRERTKANGIYHPPGGGPVEFNPVMVDHAMLPPNGTVDPHSGPLLDAIGSIKGYVDAQGAVPWHAVYPDPGGAAYRVTMARPPTTAEVAQLNDLAAKHRMFAVDTTDGVTFMPFETGDAGTIEKAISGGFEQEVARALPDQLDAKRMGVTGGYPSFEDEFLRDKAGTGAATRTLLSRLDANPEILAKADASPAVRAKALADIKRDQAFFEAGVSGPPRQDITNARNILAHSPRPFSALREALDAGKIALPALVLYGVFSDVEGSS